MAVDDDDPRATLLTATSIIPSAVQRLDPSTACLVVIYGADLGKRIPIEAAGAECGRSMTTGIPLDDDSVSRRHARFAWDSGKVVVSDLGSTNGTYVNDVSVRAQTPLRDGDQIKIGHTIFKFICGSNVEISYHEEIYKLMTCDGLTQVRNKRAFQAELEKEISRSQRYRRPMSLVLFDIDHFKKVNDDIGHLAGDAVLRQLATLISANIRREDVLARVGGEEFALILPEVGVGPGALVAEKLRALVARTPCRFEDRSIAITSSFGVAELVLTPPMTGAELYQAADERLYAAKHAGRNQVVGAPAA